MPALVETAREYGVPCPALRPARLATDDAKSDEANRFLIHKLIERGERFDAVMVLQPTSPLRTAEDIREALCLFETHLPCGVVSVSPVAPASWLGRIRKDGSLESLVGDETVYRLNGAVYVHLLDDYLRDRAAARTLVYPMPPARSVDIDTFEDLHYADCLLRRPVAV